MTHLTAPLNPTLLPTLLEQALALDPGDERVIELANTLKHQAEMSDDQEALFQSLLLLGKHHLEKQ